MCELTCLRVRVLPVLNLIYLAMSSFRPETKIMHFQSWFLVGVSEGLLRISSSQRHKIGIKIIERRVRRQDESKI